jgi:branched-chain amino acid transport system ATP-binding protein
VSTVLETVRSLVDSGLTVLLVEQNVRAAIEVVDRLVLLERGRIVAEGPAAAMRDDPRIAEAYLGAHAG